MNLSFDVIRTDGGTQPRAQTDWLVVDEYAAAIQDGAIFPPVVVYFDGSQYWLADGFHRLEAARKAGKEEIAVDLRQGTQRDAVLYSAGANASHGLRRTNEDKRRAVLRLLEDEEWNGWSDPKIAKMCSVGITLVWSLRSLISKTSEHTERTYTTKHGTIATMQTANIGRRIESQDAQDERQFAEEYFGR